MAVDTDLPGSETERKHQKLLEDHHACKATTVLVNFLAGTFLSFATSRSMSSASSSRRSSRVSTPSSSSSSCRRHKTDQGS